MLTVVFYSTNGQAAKYRSREIAATKGDYVRIIDASFWDGDPTKCDTVEMMPDVLSWQKKKIVGVFGDKAVDYESTTNELQIEESPHRKSMGLMPAKELEQAVEGEGGGKKAIHRGGGRWFVMEDEQIISGPHDKAEAKRLASE